jgi:hypothetical protein
MTAHYLDRISEDLAFSASYGEKLGIPREETITMDKVDEMVSRRMLASKENMERVIRYESHYHRVWIQTHHELEALQARRKGDRPSLLARFDVAGPPG